MAYAIDEIEGVGESYAAKLKDAGIATTDHLLKLCCDKKGRSAIAEQTGVSEKLLLKWANMADLMRIKGVGKQFAEILEQAGVDTIKELRTRNAENLAARCVEVNEAKKLAKASPTLPQVSEWIAQAKELEPTITH